MTRITYRERRFIDKFCCIDTKHTINLYKTWEVGNLIYGYKDRFNVVCISKEDIISTEII